MTVTQVLVPQLAMIGDAEGGQFLIDCLLSDDHQFNAEISTYPVESGGQIADHVRNEPAQISMECVVSNSPIGQVVNYRSKVSEPSDDAYEHLMKIRAAKKRVTIRTSLRTYEDMMLKGLSVPRSIATGDALRFTATFQQMDIVTANRTARVAIPTAKKPSSVNKPLEPTDDIDYSTYATIDPKTKTWFDRSISTWRYAALFDPKNGFWTLFRLTLEKGNAATDPFDAIRFTGRHPVHNMLLVDPKHYVIKG